MTTPLTVKLLLRLYPAAWRREYGAELGEILLARPLTFGVVADVVWSAARQRCRSADPSTILGLASMLAVLTGIVLTPTNYDGQWIGVLRPTGKTFPTVTVTLMASELYLVLLGVCGAWTYLRHGLSPRRCGVAAMKMSLIAGAPIMLAGALSALGIIDIIVVPASGGSLALPMPFVITTAPLLHLPVSWIWGALGAQCGRWIGRKRQQAAAG